MVLLERTATSASPAKATIASMLEGNSGVVDVTTVLVLFVVLVAGAAAVELVVLVVVDVVCVVLVLVVAMVLVVVVLVVVVVLLVVVEVEEVLVEVAPDEYANVTTWDAVAPLPPHVAFTENVPLVQAAFPPGWETSRKLPSERLGKTSLMSARLPAEFFTVMMTAVFGPGSGEITPVIVIGWLPEYEGASV